MAKKKLLDITTATWTEKEREEIKPHLKKYRWQANVLTKEGKKKWCFFNTKVDLEIAAVQLEFTILKVIKL
jgi:hypothetical protein